MVQLIKSFESSHFEVLSTTHDTLSYDRVSLLKQIKNYTLGQDYDLTLTLTGSYRIQTLNKQYRNKNAPTDILSFPVNNNTGDMIICPTVARKKAPLFNQDQEIYIIFLFIHGCAHLKGMQHGRTMEQYEANIRNMFCI